MKDPMRFVILPKVEHPWFEAVYQGARAQAEVLSRELGARIQVDYMPPSVADPDAQAALLEKARLGRPDGIALDPVVAPDQMAVVRSIQQDGIPLVLFDSPSPDKSIPSIGTLFAQQGILAAERLLRLMNYSGKVAVIAAHPDLKGYLCCDAAGPIGIARAIQKTGKTGVIQFVAMDGLLPILQAIKAGVIESSAASLPKMQGSMSILMLWQAALGLPIPPFVDTGVELITQENVDRYLADAG